MTHKTFGCKDSMRQNQYVGPKHDADTRRKAGITVIQNAPEEDRELILNMLGLI